MPHGAAGSTPLLKRERTKFQCSGFAHASTTSAAVPSTGSRPGTVAKMAHNIAKGADVRLLQVQHEARHTFWPEHASSSQGLVSVTRP
eukprot:jgi/Chlat1/3993/Chrsp26S03980